MRRLCIFALLGALGLASLPAAGHAAPPAACPGGDPAGMHKQVVTGTFGEALQGSYVLVPFTVGDGTTRVRVRLCHDQPDSPTSARIRHTLDLGLYEPSLDGLFDEEEFRGWGGSSRRDVFVTPEAATPGFLPGATPAGTWAAEIGIAAVAGPLEGDPDATVAWRLEIFTGTDPLDADSPYGAVAYDGTPRRNEPGWYSGDFHVHAEHSGDEVTMEETFRYAFDEAGLDFITLSDYVTSRHWGEIGALQPRWAGNLVMRSAEVITYRGHINNHASATYVDYRTGPIYELTDGGLRRIREAQPASRILADIKDAGGFTQVNHPTIFPSEVPGFDNICRGCPWDYSDEETQWELVDAYEVQTGPAGTSQPEGHELGPNPFTPLALREWDDLRSRGFRITAVGSSDSHHAGHPEDPVTQSPIGEATTVVYAPELSEQGIHQGIEAGHAYVKFFSPLGPDLRFEALALEGPGNGKGKGRPKAIMGDELPVGSARFTAGVSNLPPNGEPRTLFVFKDGAPLLAFPVLGAFEMSFNLQGAGNYRLQLQRGTAIEAITNPITLAPKA